MNTSLTGSSKLSIMKCALNMSFTPFTAAAAAAAAAFPLLPDTAFSELLAYRKSPDLCRADSEPPPAATAASEPISIPEKDSNGKNARVAHLASSPVYSSSGDSFVFVEMKAPFAPTGQHELGSFFNGPSPTFSASGDFSEQLSDISVQLAVVESSIQQWDSFVDSVCCPETEGDEEPGLLEVVDKVDALVVTN